MIVPVLLSGGVGSRLWPVSRELFPKQFLPLADKQLSMLQQTLKRAQKSCREVSPTIVCNEEHRFLVAQQLRELEVDDASIVLEPVGRNTAPAVALAALHAVENGADPLLLVMPADHVVGDEAAFADAVARGTPLAESGHLVTFGIVPTGPETGYGYIQHGEAVAESVYSIRRFVEKPDQETAQSYVDSGEFYWNGGIFLFRASAYIVELEQFAPEMLEACQRSLAGHQRDLDFIRVNREAFEACPSDSIDYAVMEHTRRGVVVPMEAQWSDVGAWSALWDVNDKCAQGNVLSGDVLSHDISNCYIRAESRLVAAVGVEDLVIVETDDAVLVSGRDCVQDVKRIVTTLKEEQRGEASLHKKVYRPWGSYESLVEAPGFQVKRIIVEPGQRLSLQMHYHRSEHWTVVRGCAEVVRGEEVILLGEDASTYIPVGTKHRLSNPGMLPLEIIEVQTGNYLGEDDIVRFDDVYGRSESDSETATATAAADDSDAATKES